jgi:hypothetical protein
MDENNRLQLWMKEIEIVQANIARFDNNGSNIKSWCVTTWSAVSAYSLSQRDPAIALVGLAIIMGFGVVELTYRRFQKRFLARAAEMEEILATDKLGDYKFSVDKAAKTPGANEVRSVFLLPHFILFYLVLGISTLAISFYCWKFPAKDAASLLLRLSS